MAKVALASQIKSVEREIAMRKAVYPKRIAAKAMKQETADHETAAMEAVLETLRRFERYEAALWVYADPRSWSDSRQGTGACRLYEADDGFIHGYGLAQEAGYRFISSDVIGGRTNESAACPAGCGHSDAEHIAFDAGVIAGERGEGDEAAPRGPNDLREAWLAGHSVGLMNRENSNESTANDRD